LFNTFASSEEREMKREPEGKKMADTYAKQLPLM